MPVCAPGVAVTASLEGVAVTASGTHAPEVVSFLYRALGLFHGLGEVTAGSLVVMSRVSDRDGGYSESSAVVGPNPADPSVIVLTSVLDS